MKTVDQLTDPLSGQRHAADRPSEKGRQNAQEPE